MFYRWVTYFLTFQTLPRKFWLSSKAKFRDVANTLRGLIFAGTYFRRFSEISRQKTKFFSQFFADSLVKGIYGNLFSRIILFSYKKKEKRNSLSAFLSFSTRNLTNDTNDTVRIEAKTIFIFSVKCFPRFCKSLQNFRIFFEILEILRELTFAEITKIRENRKNKFPKGIVI